MGLIDGILDFEGRNPVTSSFYMSLDPYFFIFFDFLGKFQSNMIK